MTAAQYCGLTCTSFLGSLLARTGERLEKDASLAWLNISPLTCSAYAVLLMALVALVLLQSPNFYDFVPADLSTHDGLAVEDNVTIPVLSLASITESLEMTRLDLLRFTVSSLRQWKVRRRTRTR